MSKIVKVDDVNIGFLLSSRCLYKNTWSSSMPCDNQCSDFRQRKYVYSSYTVLICAYSLETWALNRYRITDTLRWEETSGGLLSYLLPKAGWDTNSDQVVGALFCWVLKTSKVWLSSLWFFIATVTLSCFQLKATTSRFFVTHYSEGPCWLPPRSQGLLFSASAAISSRAWTSPAPLPSPHNTGAPSGIKFLMEIPVLGKNYSVFALLAGYFF